MIPHLLAFALVVLLFIVEIGVSVYEHSTLCSTLLANSLLLVILLYSPAEDKARSLFLRTCGCVALVAILFVSSTHALEALSFTEHAHEHGSSLWLYVALCDAALKACLVMASLIPSLGLNKPMLLVLHTVAPITVILSSLGLIQHIEFLHKLENYIEPALTFLVVVVSVAIIIPAFATLKPYVFADSPAFFQADVFKAEINNTFSDVNCSHLHVYRLWPGNSFEALIHIEILVKKSVPTWSINAKSRYEEVTKFIRSALQKGGARKVLVEPRFVDEDGERQPWKGCIDVHCQKDTGCCVPDKPTTSV